MPWPAIRSSRTSCTARGAQDAVASKLFCKLAREITVAAKLGLPDPAMNPRLRAAILAARAENMPKDNIERAIKKAAGGDGENYDEIRYEGYGAGRRRRHRRGADRQPQPHGRRGARDLHQGGRRPGRDRRGVVHVRPCRRRRIRRQGGRAPTRCWKPRSRPAPRTSCRARTATRSSPRRKSLREVAEGAGGEVRRAAQGGARLEAAEHRRRRRRGRARRC